MRQQAIRSIRDDMCFVLNEENEQVVGGNWPIRFFVPLGIICQKQLCQ